MLVGAANVATTLVFMVLWGTLPEFEESRIYYEQLVSDYNCLTSPSYNSETDVCDEGRQLRAKQVCFNVCVCVCVCE